MPTKVYQIDAFTNTVFSGNPAAVVLMDTERDETWMQKVAAEMNLSESAFLHRQGDGYHLRWFTPTTEVDLCGHATLASAHVLFEEETELDVAKINFYTNSGVLTAGKSDDWIQLDFLSEPPVECDAPPDLLTALGVERVAYVGKNRFDYIIEVDSETTVRALQPDWSVLQRIETRGVIVTSRSADRHFDFVSRAFFPRIGVNEDPVTGSAHCCLGPYWQRKLNKDTLHAYQASARGGELKLSISEHRVLLFGQAATVLRGELL